MNEYSSRMSVTGSSRSYIDSDEISDLLKGLAYISKASNDVTKHKYFEVRYSTRGNFSVTTFNDSEGKTKASIESGRLTAHLPMAKFKEFQSFIVNAKVKLNQTK